MAAGSVVYIANVESNSTINTNAGPPDDNSFIAEVDWINATNTDGVVSLVAAPNTNITITPVTGSSTAAAKYSFGTSLFYITATAQANPYDNITITGKLDITVTTPPPASVHATDVITAVSILSPTAMIVRLGIEAAPNSITFKTFGGVKYPKLPADGTIPAGTYSGNVGKRASKNSVVYVSVVRRLANGREILKYFGTAKITSKDGGEIPLTWELPELPPFDPIGGQRLYLKTVLMSPSYVSDVQVFAARITA